ncbi:patched domain-containing protein 3-like [Saccoglossus kowalevskii]|uniref:Patched domain-containing protein 3-like n=1 Tax=Saccoglossus kowalevskii TaxID=10224 RepID=A0ABM0MV92_SACKO|nr:PREDICTED: patched domain-containing protein 3-like [Saccoglossus kowalevskii]
MAFDCFESRLKVVLCRYGRVVGNYPIPFIIFPILLTFSLALGGFYFTRNNDIEYLFTPTNGPAKKHRDELESFFPANYSGEFLTNRQTHVGRYASVIIYTKNESENVLAVDSLREIFSFHDNVTDTKARIGRNVYSYRQLCAKWKTQCVDPNPVLNIYNYTTQNVNFINISYPVMAGDIAYFIGGSLGGVQFYDDTSIVKSARAIVLFYPLKHSPNDLDEASIEFEEKIKDMALNFKSMKITVTLTVSRTLPNDLKNITLQMMPMMVLTFVVLTAFSVLSLMMADWVTSKPVLGSLGVISALLAVISTIGLLSFCGVPFIHLNIAMPFLTLGVGVDDMFIMIASWRTTPPRNSVPDRMAETFSEAALSITITSITDVLAFGIGAISTFPSVQIFGCYCGVAILFDYIYQITFFGGCMALIGRRERQNKHCLTYVKVLPKKESQSLSYRLFCAGGISNSTDCDDVVPDHLVMTFFDKYYGPFITLPWMKLVTLILYLAYISVAIWGCFKVSEGIQPRQLALEDSYSVDFYDAEERYFNEYGPVVQIVVIESENYSHSDTQNEIERVLFMYGENEYFYGTEYSTQSWLRDYLDFLDNAGLSYSDEDTFVSLLRSYFLTNPLYEHYKSDIALSNNTIISSRYSVQSRYVKNVKSVQNSLHQSRKIAENSRLPMIAYHPTFVFNDHFDAILPNTVQNIAIAAVAMLVVSLLLIPHPICALYVTLTVASIVVGVVGYMSLWGVGLDFVSMITIVVCIGFSVDYSAHLTYAFVISPRETRNRRAIYGLYLLGLPVVQSVASTIISIAALSNAKTYVFRAVFKTMFFGIFWGGVHGILFLPVLLSVVGPKNSKSPKPKAGEENESGEGVDGVLGQRQLRVWMKEHRLQSLEKQNQKKGTRHKLYYVNDKIDEQFQFGSDTINTTINKGTDIDTVCPLRSNEQSIAPPSPVVNSTTDNIESPKQFGVGSPPPNISSTSQECDHGTFANSVPVDGSSGTHANGLNGCVIPYQKSEFHNIAAIENKTEDV